MTSPETLDQVTCDLVFALRDSLTDDGPSRLDFWGGRAATALETAAAASSSAGQAITTACRKLQIPTLTTAASKTVTACAAVIDADYEAWAGHVARNVIYLVALANVQRDARKTQPSKTTTTKEPTF